MSARGILIALAAALVMWLFLWWMVSLTQRGLESSPAVETVVDVSLPKPPHPTTTTTLPPTTTTTARARTAPTVRTASVGRPAPEPAVAPTGMDFDSAHKPPPGRYAGSVNGSPCGDTLPPCRTLWIESKGSPTAVNPTGCNGRGCFGAWQYDPLTWNNYAGYDEANLAPLSVQNEKARLDWSMGAGCSHWAACG